MADLETCYLRDYVGNHFIFSGSHLIITHTGSEFKPAMFCLLSKPPCCCADPTQTDTVTVAMAAHSRKREMSVSRTDNDADFDSLFIHQLRQFSVYISGHKPNDNTCSCVSVTRALSMVGVHADTSRTTTRVAVSR